MHAAPTNCFFLFHSALFDFYHYFYMVTNVLFYVSSAINPILYNLVSANYRQIFFSTLRYLILPCRHKKQKRVLTRHSISICSNQTFSTNVIKETIYWTLSRFSHSIPLFQSAKERPLERRMFSYGVIITRIYYVHATKSPYGAFKHCRTGTRDIYNVYGKKCSTKYTQKTKNNVPKQCKYKKANVYPDIHY